MSAGEREHAEQQLRQRAKLALRKQMRAVRAALPSSACETRSARIVERVLNLDQVARASTVLAFAAIQNEVRTAAMIDAFHGSNKRVALPRVLDDALALHVVEPGSVLEEGAFGVPEPAPNFPSIAPEDVDFALIPALAVDDRGYRIGYGGGYYDRLLPSLSRACTCAIAYDFQLIAEVPNLPFDVSVDLVVTDERLIVCA